MLLQTPTEALVIEACERFDEENRLVEKTLCELFELFPFNKDLKHVFLKVITLNCLYGTQIPVTSTTIPVLEEVANHIHLYADEIDSGLAYGSPEVVGKIALISVEGKKARTNYSFATKCGSWHKPTVYPIWDSRVDRYLWHLQKRDHFSGHFKTNADLWTYSSFREVMTAFRTAYKLDVFTFKQLDKFLWLYGEPSVPKQHDEDQHVPAMEPEPALIIDGVWSDESLHAEMLNNEPANLLADESARRIARELGFTEEQIAEMIRPPGLR